MAKLLEETRPNFEERVYNRHFLSTITRTDLGGPLTYMPDPAQSLTLEELCERNDKGNYKRPAVDAMWFGWQLALEMLQDADANKSAEPAMAGG